MQSLVFLTYFFQKLSKVNFKDENYWNISHVLNICWREIESQATKYVSSAYAESLISVLLILIPLMSPVSLIYINITSKNRINRYAHKAPACLKPLSSLEYPSPGSSGVKCHWKTELSTYGFFDGFCCRNKKKLGERADPTGAWTTLWTFDYWQHICRHYRTVFSSTE